MLKMSARVLLSRLQTLTGAAKTGGVCWGNRAAVSFVARHPAPQSSTVVQAKGVAFRRLCTAPSRTVTYEELKDLLGSHSITIIDVREAWEIKEYGKIPGSINIPVGEVAAALEMSPHDFKVKYNQNMPAKSESVVFSCLAGVRSLKALDAAVSLGYNRAQHYLGGFDDFVRHEVPVKK